MPYRRFIVGGVSDGFTSAEIENEAQEVVGRVFETEAGWCVECDPLDKLQDAEFMEAALAARDELLHYVNRTGAGMPEGLTVAGASLWLMQRDDGKGFTSEG